MDARPSTVRRDQVGTNVQELYRRILWTFSAGSSTTSLPPAAQGRVISGKHEGIDIPDLDGRNALGQRRAQHHHHVPAGIDALPRFEAEDVGLTQPTVLGQFVARFTGLDPKTLECFCELQPVTFLSWETDTRWSTPASIGVGFRYRGEEPVWVEPHPVSMVERLVGRSVGVKNRLNREAFFN